MGKQPRVICGLIGVLLFRLSTTAVAQVNSWTNSASGGWEDSGWSAGILPGTNEAIFFTNAGWKALAIGPNTVKNFPQTMTVDSISISSPPLSYNALLLNYAGTETPLTVKAISVESNSALTMLSSTLELNGPNGIGLQVGGEFNQTDSRVSGRQINVGYNGPGVYNLNSGILEVSNLWVGGSFDGVFNQTGGTNNTGIVGIDAGGTYNFSGGECDATVYFDYDTAVFNQTGGDQNQAQTVYVGTYLQNGGTNFGALTAGAYSRGNYVLSNGYCFPSDLNVGQFGTFHQFGGTAIITNGLYLDRDAIDFSPRAPNGGFTAGGVYWLSGGTLTTSNMEINFDYIQDGGTNVVAGGVQVDNFEPLVLSGVQLNGGLMKADYINLTFGGALQLSGGKLMVNNLNVYGEVPPTMALWGPDVQCLGGELMVSNIDVEYDYFAISGTTVHQSGTLKLGGNSSLLPGAGTYTFGPLSGSGTLVLPTNVDCQIHFGDGSSPSLEFLIIHNWSGSIYGGGLQRVFFGTNATALTTNQLQDILFEGLEGLPPAPYPGNSYPARILATGEVVPDTGTPLPIKMTATCVSTNGLMQLSLGADIGQSYDIEVSTNLVNWLWWTNEFNSNGTIYLDDLESTNVPQRFYRARQAP